MDPAPRPTDIILRPASGGLLARYATGAPGDDAGRDPMTIDPQVLSWSLRDLEAFSLSPTILQALNRLRVLAGMEPLRAQADGSIDMPEDPLQYQYHLEEPQRPFAS